MHKEAYEFCQRYENDSTGWALDIGGRNANGSARELWPNRIWTIVDPLPPTGTETNDGNVKEARYIQKNVLDINKNVGDLVIPPTLFLCTEVFEHTPEWPLILHWVHQRMMSFATILEKPVATEFIITCAGPFREPHNSTDGGPLLKGEYYRGIDSHELDCMLSHYGFREYQFDWSHDGEDIYAHVTMM